MADSTPRSYHTDPQLYLYTSLTSGSSQIVTATSRLQTILNANRITFQALDVATDEKARMLWGRRAGKRKLPGLVRYGMILGDLEQVEEWNEYGEIKENLTETKPAASTSTPSASAANTPSKPPPAPAPPTSTELSSKGSPAPETPVASSVSDSPTPEPSKADAATSLADAMRQVGFEAAKKAGDAKTKARNDVLEAAKSRNPDLQKLDNSAPTGMPPPSGMTEAAEAQKPETGTTSAESKADDVPATTMDDERAQEAEENAIASSVNKSPQEVLDSGDGPSKSDIPSSADVDKKANEAIAQDEEEVLEGTGQAESEEVDVPTAKEVEAEANQAIVDDTSDHVRVKGRGSVPHALSPELPKQNGVEGDQKPEIREIPAEASKELQGDLGSAKEEQEFAENSETVRRQEEKVGVAATPASPSATAKPLGVKPIEEENALENVTSETAKRQEEKVGVAASPGEPKEPAASLTDQPIKEGNAPETPATANSSKTDDDNSKVTTTSVTGSMQALPGSKTQDQPAAAGEKVGESVED